MKNILLLVGIAGAAWYLTQKKPGVSVPGVTDMEIPDWLLTPWTTPPGDKSEAYIATAEQAYQENVAGIMTTQDWVKTGVSEELGQLFVIDDLASARVAAIREAERATGGDVYASKELAGAIAVNQLVDSQRMYQEGIDTLRNQGLLDKYYEGGGSGGWFDKLRNLEITIPEQEALVANPITVREQNLIDAELAAIEDAIGTKDSATYQQAEEQVDTVTRSTSYSPTTSKSVVTKHIASRTTTRTPSGGSESPASIYM